MRILLGIVLLFNFIFAQEISLEDIQKYQQYKGLLQNSGGIVSQQKKVKQSIVKNDIEDNSISSLTQTDENNNTLEVQDSKKEQNIFKYDYKKDNLKRFGDNFFKNKNRVNELIIPTSDNYILNNGDTLLINTYSTNSKTYELTIDNNGNISIPKIGLIKVGSLSLKEVKVVISNILKKAFPGIKVVVDISGYSTIQVIITGNVNVPGIYNLSSFSTVKDALLASNGLMEVGSYRDIDVIRSGKVIYKFDLYKLLKAKDINSNIILRNGDIVSVNFTKKTIYLDGKVKYPAIYELKDKETYKDLMNYCGGFDYDATKHSIRVERYDENKKLKVYILSKKEFFALKPKDGDKIYVFNNYELKEKPYIYVYGKVIGDPTKYSYFDGITIKDLFSIVTFKSELITYEEDKSNNQDKNSKEEIEKKELREALFIDKDNIKIVRNNAEEKRVFLVKSTDEFKLKPYDEVEFFNYFDTHPRISVHIKGAVYNNGEIFIDEGTTLKDLIELSGGFTKRAYKKEFELVRYKIVDNQRIREIKKLDLNKALKGKFILQDSDEITIFTIPNWYDRKTITLKGEVKFPGVYTIKTGERLSSVIKRAGGFTEEAFIEGAMFTRESIRENEQRRMNEKLRNLKQQIAFISSNGKELGASNNTDLTATITMLEKQAKEYKALGRLVVYLDRDINKFEKSIYNIRLKDKDTLIIPSFNDTVSVYGEVLNPNSFIYNAQYSCEEYIKLAGGFNQRADQESIYVVNANGEAKKVDTGWFGNFDETLQRGSTVIVPMKINSISNVILWKEISQIAYQLAVTAASLNTVGAI